MPKHTATPLLPVEMQTLPPQLPVHFSIIAGPAVLDSNLLTITGAGEVTVMAIQEGNENYLADSTEQTFTVNKAGQTITFPVIAPRIKYQTVTLEAAASAGCPLLIHWWPVPA